MLGKILNVFFSLIIIKLKLNHLKGQWRKTFARSFLWQKKQNYTTTGFRPFNANQKRHERKPSKHVTDK